MELLDYINHSQAAFQFSFPKESSTTYFRFSSPYIKFPGPTSASKLLYTLGWCTEQRLEYTYRIEADLFTARAILVIPVRPPSRLVLLFHKLYLLSHSSCPFSPWLIRFITIYLWCHSIESGRWWSNPTLLVAPH